MAKHYCKFTYHSYYYSDKEIVGEVISTFCKSNEPYFVIECDGYYYTEKVENCRPVKRPKKKKDG